MRLPFGFEITRTKSQPLQAVPSRGWFNVIREGFPGAFQANVEVDGPRDLLAFSAVYACTTLIASDVAKLQPRLMVRRAAGGTWQEDESLPQAAILRKPNHYQTRAQFYADWITSKLLHGNAYILKDRDAKGATVGLYGLNAERVTPMITPTADVYYKIAGDWLSGVKEEITVPARYIIHDRMNCLWHPLVGVSPIYAAGLSATQGRRIQNNSAMFFGNMSRPSGMLSAPATIDDQTALRLKSQFEQTFAGGGLGRLFVAGDDLSYTQLTMNAVDAQLIEQLRWDVEDVARCFHVPLFKIGGPVPASTNVESMNSIYYSDCLQSLIESMEQSLDEGLGLDQRSQRTEFDIEGGLLRMDTAAQFDALNKAVGGGWMSPDEARARVNLPPVPGGDTPYLQQQFWALSHLAGRTAAPDGVQPGDATAKAIEALLLRDAAHSRAGYITKG